MSDNSFKPDFHPLALKEAIHTAIEAIPPEHEPEIQLVWEDQVLVASRCLDAELHNGRRLGLLHDVLDTIWDGRAHPHKVVGLTVDGVYVGCAVHNRRTRMIMVYVHPDHRRKGYGSRLIEGLETMLGINRDKFQAMLGDEGCEVFYDLNDVIIYPDTELTTDETLAVLSNEVSANTLVKRKRHAYRRKWLDRYCTPNVPKE